MNQALAAAFIALVAGFGAAWNIQAQRWDTDVARIRGLQTEALMLAYSERDEKVAQAENQKEQIQNEFNAFKEAEAKRDTAVSSGTQRVYVRAKCPAVPATQADSGRAESGAAELDPAYRSTLSQLRAGVEDQRRLLNLCRAEFMHK